MERQLSKRSTGLPHPVLEEEISLWKLRGNVPELGSGRVMHVVKAFEKLFWFLKSN